VHVFTPLFVFSHSGVFSHHIVKVMALLVPLWLANFAARGLYS